METAIGHEKASQCTEPVQQDRYRGYPSHEDVQMPSSSDTLSEYLQHHLDQENLHNGRKRFHLTMPVASFMPANLK